MSHSLSAFAIAVLCIASSIAFAQEPEETPVVIMMEPPPDRINPATVPSEGDRMAYALMDALPTTDDLAPRDGRVPLDVLVLYLGAGVEFSPEEFKTAYTAHFGTVFPAEPEEKDNQVVGDAELLVVRDGGWDYLLMVQPHHVANMAMLDKIGKDDRLREAINAPAAVVWICSVGIPTGVPDQLVHTRTGQIATMFRNHKPLAIYCDGTGDFIPWEEGTSDDLFAGNFAKLFPSPRRYAAGVLLDDQRTVQETHAGDPLLLEAKRRAQENWLEFYNAFQTRGEESRFFVRFPFPTDDGEEQLWLRVTRIHGAEITAIVSNTPVAAKLVKDQEVTVSLRELNDWLFFREGDMLGGFTQKVQQEQESKTE